MVKLRDGKSLERPILRLLLYITYIIRNTRLSEFYPVGVQASD